MKEQYIKRDAEGNTYYYSDKEMSILHREDGAAFEANEDGRHNEWWLNGVNVSKGTYEHHIRRIRKRREPTTLRDKEFMVVDVIELDMYNDDYPFRRQIVFTDTDYTTTKSWAEEHASPKAVIVETIIDKDDLMTADEYEQLLNSGMLWELYPDWYGTYSVDILGYPKPE